MSRSTMILFLVTCFLSTILVANEKQSKDKPYIDAGKTIQRVLNKEDREKLLKDSSALDKKDVFYIQYHLLEKTRFIIKGKKL